MTERVIHYLMSGPAHLPYLIVSLDQLRHRANWDGAVIVHAWEESHLQCMYGIGQDNYLDVDDVVLRTPKYRGKNDQFLDKIQLMREQPKDECSLYLDADTMPQHEDIEHLFELAETYSFCATQFCDWVSNGGLISKRISNLQRYPEVNQTAVQKALTEPLPSVNGGVFACMSDSLALQIWQDWANACKDIFICDETALHAVMAQEWPQGRMAIAEGGAWNCSPKHQPKELVDADVTLWHFHGDSNVRPEKSQKGMELWWPRFEWCLNQDLGSMNEWLWTCGNSRLLKLLGERKQNAG